jgi:hypothetical protein
LLVILCLHEDLREKGKYRFELRAGNKYGASESRVGEMVATVQPVSVNDSVNAQPPITISPYYKLYSQYICIYTNHELADTDKHVYYLKLTVWSAARNSVHYEANLIRPTPFLNTCFSFADFKKLFQTQAPRFVVDLDAVFNQERAPEVNDDFMLDQSFARFKKSFSINITLCKTNEMCFANASTVVGT